MFLSKLKRVAEVVGLACFVLLAILGLLSLVRGEAATAASVVLSPAAAPISAVPASLAPPTTGPYVPPYMNYQGVLRDVDGNPLTGSYDLTFRVYANVADPVESALWTDTHAGIVVRDGWFNVLLGDQEGNPMPATLFDSPDRFIGVTVGTDDELIPRQRFASVPYAVQASRQVPAGTIVMYGGTSLPDGWLWANGAAYSRTQYAGLFAAIGTTYGPGDGSTTFNVPNFIRRFPIGYDATNSDYWLAHWGGEETHTLTVNEMPNHNHTVVSVPNYDAAWGWVTGSVKGDPETLQTSYTGGDAAHNNMPPYLVVNFIIKY